MLISIRMVGITKEMVGMRKLTLLLTTLIFFSVMFSPSTSFAGWKKVGEDVYGDTHYVDLRESKTRWVCFSFGF
jgi:hypothetical protein